MRIGLLGGSFNPAHAGHLAVARLALRRLRLDAVWLLVSPGNPLKARTGMAPLVERLEAARGIADGRRVVATDVERLLNTRYTVDTLRRLRRLFPRARFVWLMGADGLAEFTRWKRWEVIARTVPVAVLPRPGWNRRALAGAAASRLASGRRPGRTAAVLAEAGTGNGERGLPAWCFVPAPELDISSTRIRQSGAGPWPRGAERG